METLFMPVGDFKSRFSEALEIVAQGGSVCVTYGRTRKPVAVLMPPEPRGKRKLGLFAGRMKVKIGKDWEISEADFLQG
jgi:antitoxin (DNA-binding transcriptional repressor) of toxin-antitoxin stability system